MSDLDKLRVEAGAAFGDKLDGLLKAFDRLIVSHKRLRVAQNELIGAALEVIGISHPDLETAYPESFERLRLAVQRAQEVYKTNE